METPVIGAIITSIASCIVSTVTFISTKNTGKRNGKLQKELEEIKFELEIRRIEKNTYAEKELVLLKYELEESKRKVTTNVELIGDKIEVLDKFIILSQEMKNHIEYYLSILPLNHSTDDILSKMLKTAKKYEDAYNNGFFQFSDTDIRPFAHSIKPTFREVYLLITSPETLYNLTEFQNRERLVSIREQLTSAQTKFIKERDNFLWKIQNDISNGEIRNEIPLN